MDWIKLIIVLVGVVAWIAGNLREKNKIAQPGPPPLPPPDPNAPPAPRQAEDLQDFLKQIRRRMGEPESKAGEPLTAVLVEEPRPKPQPPAPRPKPKKKEPLAPTMQRRAAEVTMLVPEAGKLKPAVASDPAPMVSARKKSTAVANDVVDLLRSPNGLANAFLLREILDKPLSKRHRHRF